MRVQMYKGTAYNPVVQVERELAKKDARIKELEKALTKKSEKKGKEKQENEKSE